MSIGWYLLFMLCSAIWKGEGFLSNEIGKWLWFVVVPLGLVWRARGIPKTTIAALLRSIGWRRQGLGTAVRLGFTAFLVVAPLAIWSFSATQQQKLWAVMQQPLKLFTLLPISFLLALFTAGITEEVFFRGIIQSRLAGAMGSEMRGCVITAFLFGIYHLPYAYFMTSWPTHGNFFWALSAVITEQAITGWLMGILWMRTRHLAASIVFHASVNTLAVLTMLKY